VKIQALVRGFLERSRAKRAKVQREQSEAEKLVCRLRTFGRTEGGLNQRPTPLSQANEELSRVRAELRRARAEVGHFACVCALSEALLPPLPVAVCVLCED
jgi:hypothetical protein